MRLFLALSERNQNIQDNPEYKSILPFKIILKIFAVNMLVCQFWSTRKVHHKHYVYNLYIKFIQDVYTNNCMQHGSLISTFFILFVVHVLANHCKQLRLENCNLTTGGTIKSKDYWIIYCIKMPVIKLNKSKSPCIYGKNTIFV